MSISTLIDVPITVIGAWYFLRAGLSMGEISGAQRSAEVGKSAQGVRVPVAELPPASTPPAWSSPASP